MDTLKMTMAQALVRFLNQQYLEVDGEETPLFAGVMTIFGHGNVLGIGQALEQDAGHLQVHQGCNEQGMAHIAEEEKTTGGALGRPSGARFKTYERIKRWRERQGNTRDLFITDEYIRRIDKALEDIYRFPLYQSATDTLNRQLKAGINDTDLIDLVFNLREDGRLCLVDEQGQQREPRLICSLGLA